MKISVFGLGYVGTVTAACLAADGHSVTGVDPNAAKLDFLKTGRSPIIEAYTDEMIAKAVKAGRLRASSDAHSAIADTEISFVCVGTPSRKSGALDLSFIERVCTEIGTALGDIDHFHIVNIRSTILPGTMRETVIPLLERASGRKAGVDFGVCHNPEFLREGSAIDDFRNPPKTVIGALDERSGEIVANLYQNLDAPLIKTSIDTAEMVKYTDNVWHALKVGFANEIGVLCKSLNIDSHEVMNIFCQDEKLNLSRYYLKPGFAFGGSCLPKDVRALTYRARKADIPLPILENILSSNDKHILRGLEMIVDSGARKIGVLGCSFKAGTDDLRESPMIEIIERLIGKGYDVKIFDDNVRIASLTGANKSFIMERIPHIASILCENLDDVLDHAETVVIGTNDPAFADIASRLSESHHIVDFVRIGAIEAEREKYDGVCW